jgi:hypothetical protein
MDYSITWVTRTSERELSRTVYAPTADECVRMMNAIEEADYRRSNGMPMHDDQAHNQSANVGSQG